MQIQLPKLRKIGVDRPKKKKIFLISDSIEFNSGVSTAVKEIVLGTADKYDWVQLGAALHHPNHGKVIDLSQEVERETGFTDVYCKIYAHSGYGNPNVIREVIAYEKPDAIMLVTDPRFFGHIFVMEHELRTTYKIPLIYWNLWDNLSFPIWNASAYASCDILLSINRQSKNINREVLKYHETNSTVIDEPYSEVKGTLLSYLPHGSNPKYFFKENPQSPDWAQFCEFKESFYKKHNVDFVVFFNSRNIRRKQPGDVILAFRRFCDQLPSEKAKRCALVMKTAIMDENGTDLIAVKKAICPKYKVLFNQEMIPSQVMNWFYNLADCTFFMSSAEGFGMAGNESLMSGTMLIAPVTGGLQDQMRFEDENGEWIKFDENFSSNHRGKFKQCGEWAVPIFPKARALQGSIPTPYIFDDYSDAEDASKGLLEIYNMGKEERNRRGLEGQKWVLGEESGMSAPEVCKGFVKAVDVLFETWKPKNKFELVQVNERKEITNDGIVWSEN